MYESKLPDLETPGGDCRGESGTGSAPLGCGGCQGCRTAPCPALTPAGTAKATGLSPGAPGHGPRCHPDREMGMEGEKNLKGPVSPVS